MNWFIVENNEKIGPFTKPELDNYISSREEGETLYIQSEKMQMAMPYNHIFGKEDLSDLPPLPTLNMRVLEKTPTEDKTGEFSIEELAEISSLDKEKKGNNTLKFALLLIAIVLLVLVGAFYYLKNITPSLNKHKDISLNSFQVLKQTVGSDELVQDFLFAVDKQSFWFATSNMGEGRLRLTLKSTKKENLADKNISITSNSFLKEGVAYFDQLSMSDAFKVVDGFYKVKVESIEDLQSNFIYRLRPFKKNILFEGKLLISLANEKEFRTKLRENFLKKYGNSIDFQKELLQKYLTLQSIVSQIKESFLNAFSESDLDWKQRVASFKKNYTASHGQFFTSFVIENEKHFEQINAKEFPDKIQIISGYTRLTKLAKRAGYVSAETIESLEAFKFYEALLEDIVLLKEKSLKEYDDIISICQERLEGIQAYLADKDISQL